MTASAEADASVEDPRARLRELRRHSYENPRPDVQALVPRTARRVLDVGCASGALGAALKARGTAEVVGIELDEAYAAAAERRLDRVVRANVAELAERPELAAELGSFDCLLCADVLEHLADPWATLRALAALLEPGGTAVVSLPNVRHWRTFWALGRHGRWPRHPDGIYDMTHLRWFTARDAIDLLEGAGLAVDDVRQNVRVRSQPSRLDDTVGAFAEAVPGLRGFVTFQYLLVGRRR